MAYAFNSDKSTAHVGELYTQSVRFEFDNQSNLTETVDLPDGWYFTNTLFISFGMMYNPGMYHPVWIYGDLEDSVFSDWERRISITDDNKLNITLRNKAGAYTGGITVIVIIMKEEY